MTTHELEDKMTTILTRMREVRESTDEDRDEQMSSLLLQWLAAQLTWLVDVKGMNWEKAKAMVTTFSLVGPFASWFYSCREASPPMIMTLYRGEGLW